MCYYETDFNIVVVLGQLSDYNAMLKEQVDTRKCVQRVKRKTIREEHVLNPKMRSKEN